MTSFVENEYFSVEKWDVKGDAIFEQPYPFLLCSVIDGSGTIVHQGAEYKLEKGAHFMLPNQFGEFSLNGDMELIVSHI
ncbi:MAG: hypothetical protein ACI4WD_06945 [Lactococcus garvieae]